MEVGFTNPSLVNRGVQNAGTFNASNGGVEAVGTTCAADETDDEDGMARKPRSIDRDALHTAKDDVRAEELRHSALQSCLAGLIIMEVETR